MEPGVPPPLLISKIVTDEEYPSCPNSVYIGVIGAIDKLYEDQLFSNRYFFVSQCIARL